MGEQINRINQIDFIKYYRSRPEVPYEWKSYYFDKGFKAWLETVDD
ncbi:hypothetical protein [Legionella shakespearei]|nr:hypothetical protein [Legionella shakespearei]